MGHIKDRWKEPGRRGKGLRWQVRYQVDGREKVGGSFDVKAVAQRKLVELEASVHRGQWVNPHDQTTVTAECRSYAASRPHADTTAERVESMIRNHVEPTPLGKMRIAAVRPGDIQRWVTERAGAGMAPSTLRVLVRLVRSTFAAAVLDRRVSSSPFVRIALPAAEAERIVPLAAAQVVALRAAMAPRYRAMVTTQAGLGLRVGELLALRTQDVAFLHRAVRVDHQIHPRTRQRVAPKTSWSRRTVPMPDEVSVALAEHIHAHPPAEGGLLFHTRDGLPYWREVYQEVFTAAVTRAKLPPGTTSHDLRHWFASELLAAGESVVTVAERLGHRNAELVIKVYGHLIPGSDDRTRKAIDGAFRAASAGPEESATTKGSPG